MFLVNITGAFALGLLLETLARSGASTGRRQQVRMFLGTGFLGTFTTYSFLAVEADLLIGRTQLPFTAGYLLASVAAGLAAVLAGIAAASALTKWRKRDELSL